MLDLSALGYIQKMYVVTSSVACRYIVQNILMRSDNIRYKAVIKQYCTKTLGLTAWPYQTYLPGISRQLGNIEIDNALRSLLSSCYFFLFYAWTSYITCE